MYLALSDIPPQQVINVAILVFPVAVCLEIVLPGPPFRIAVCARNTDEAFQSTFGGSFTMSSRLVVTITVVLGREADIFGHAFSVTALEWFRVFAFMFTLVGQRWCPTTCKSKYTYV